MTDDLMGVTTSLAVDRNTRDLPRRHPQQQQSRRQHPRPPTASPPEQRARPADEVVSVGTRLNVVA